MAVTNITGRKGRGISKVALMTKCPQCLSENTKFVQYMGINCLVCNECGYSEIESYEVYPEDRTSQKSKARYTNYRTGGGTRAVSK